MSDPEVRRMAELMDLPLDVEIIDANVLVIGGGFAGAWAALRAAELTSGVVLVEKAYVSRSGASTMSGGVTSCPLDGDDLNAWSDEFIVRGGYLGHPAWARKMLEGQRQRVKDFVSWGVPIIRDEAGEIRRFLSRGMVSVRCMQYSPKAAMTELREQVLARGASILDRFCITDLLTADGMWPTGAGIVGAIGFHVRDGRFVVFRAKRTIVCSGMIGVRIGINPIDNDTGDGAAMAYRAGAKLADLEFTLGGTFSIGAKRFKLSSYNVAIAHGARLINAHGERFMEKYDPVRFERGELPLVVAAFTKELLDGRGPCYLDYRHCDPTYWDDIRKLGRAGHVLLSDQIPDPRVHPLLIEATWGIFSSDGRGGITIDIDCRTNLPGLLAAGACAKNGAIGTHGSAGAPTAWAMNSGWWAGDTAARDSLAMAQPQIPLQMLAELREATLAPLGRTSGATPDGLHDRLTAFENEMVDNIVLDTAKLRARVASVDAIAADWPAARAADLHDLTKLYEARSVADCAKLIYRSALDRTESREQFYRVEFPYTDDEHWFCWHEVQLTADGMVFSRLQLPFDEGAVRPAKRPKQLSPIAAIMQGTYDHALYDHVVRPVERLGV